MKLKISKIAALALVGLSFAVVGCKDYDADIAAINERIDNLSSQTVAGLSQQVDGIQATVDALEALNIKDRLSDLESDIVALKKADADLADMDTKLSGLISNNSKLIADNAKLIGDNAKNISDNTAAIKKNADDIIAANKAIQEIKDALDLATKDTTSASFLEKLAGLALKAQANADAIAQNIKDIDADEAAIKVLQDSSASYAAEIAAALARIGLAEGSIQANTTSIQNIVKELDNNIKGRVVALETKVSALEKADSALNGRIDSLKGWVNTLEGYIDDDVKDLASYKKITDSTLVELKKAIGLLQQADIDLDKKIDGVAKTFNDWLFGKFATFYEGTNTSILALQNAMKAEIAARQADSTTFTVAIADLNKLIYTDSLALAKAIEALGNELNGTIGKDTLFLSQRIAKLNETLSSTIKELNDLKLDVAADSAEFAQKIADLVVMDQKLQGEIDNLDTKVDSLYDITSKAIESITEDGGTIDTKIADAIQKLIDEDITDINNRIDTIVSDFNTFKSETSAAIAKLFARVQSIVYVPDYIDGKASLHVVACKAAGVSDFQAIKGKVNGLTSSMSFLVKPDSLAGKIADAFAKNPGLLKFMVKSVNTRGAKQDENLKIIKAEANGSGVLVLGVQASGFSPNFLTKDCYSASLCLEDPLSANSYSTEFINLTCQSSDGKFIHQLTLDEESESYEVYLDYLSDSTYSYFKNLEPKFKITGIDSGNAHEAQYFKDSCNFDLWDLAPVSGVATLANAVGRPLSYTTDVDSLGFFSIDIKIKDTTAAAKRSLIDQTITFDTYYGINDASSKESTKKVVFHITKSDSCAVAYPTATYNWSWANNLPTDKERAAGNKTNPYQASNVQLGDTSSFSNNFTTFGVSFADFNSDPDSVKIDGNKLPDAARQWIFNIKNDSLYVTFSDMNLFGKTSYKIVGYYTLTTGPARIEATVSCVDRARDIINVTLKDTAVVYKKDLAVTCGLEDIAGFYDNVTYADGVSFADYVTEGLENSADLTWASSGSGKADFTPGFDAAAGTYKLFYGDSTIRKDSVYVYRDTLTSTFGQKVAISKKITVSLPKYNLGHNAYYVKDDAGTYKIQVNPCWTPSKDVLAKFSVDSVRLYDAFYVVESDGTQMNLDSVASRGLKYDFAWRTAPEDAAHITLDTEKGTVSYGGYDEYVLPNAKLYIENTDGSKTYLPTAFDAPSGKYATLQVVKYNPFKTFKFTQANETIAVSDAKEYSVNLLKFLKVVDSRDKDLVNNGAWITGNGNNGFGMGVNPLQAYDVEAAPSMELPSSLTPAQKAAYKLEGYTLTYDHSGQMALVQDIVVTVTVKLTHKWTKEPMEATMTVTFHQD